MNCNMCRRVAFLCWLTTVSCYLPSNDASGQNLRGLKSEIAKVLQKHNVPGASVAVVLRDRVVWTDGVGVVDTETKREVKANTLFQAASISKPVTAFGALSLVQSKNLALDVPVDRYLKHVKFAAAKQITLRQLLSHSSGLSVGGYGGYTVGQKVPTLQQVLNGERPANSEAVVLKARPGTAYSYSGGGYCVVQQIIADTTGKSFPEAMNMLVLTSLKMKDSTFHQPIPKELAARAATGHDGKGRPVEGKYRTHPEMAAAGLWTTAGDLANFILAVQSSYSGNRRSPLKKNTAVEMLTAQVSGGPGLGLFVHQSGAAETFYHSGWNHGFRANIIASKKMGNGLVILTNSDDGNKAFEDIQAVVRVAFSRR